MRTSKFKQQQCQAHNSSELRRCMFHFYYKLMDTQDLEMNPTARVVFIVEVVIYCLIRREMFVCKKV